MLHKIALLLLLGYLCAAGSDQIVNQTQPEPEHSEKKQIFNLGTFLGLNFTESANNATVEEPPAENITYKYVHCLPKQGSHEVQLVNDTELIKLLLPDGNITSRDAPANCVLVLFYSKFCPFSSQAAPHYNALPRVFPDVKIVAINAMIYHIFNTQNGIVGVPSLLLFHNGRPVAKYNDSKYNLDLFSKFLTKQTGIGPIEEKKCVSSADFGGPVFSVPSKETDGFLILSWVFLYVCAGYFFTKSWMWQWIVETIQKYWRESEQHAEHENEEHEHQD